MATYLGYFLRIQKKIYDHDAMNDADEEQIEGIRFYHLIHREIKKRMARFHFNTS
jgi:hypothetical protein